MQWYKLLIFFSFHNPFVNLFFLSLSSNGNTCLSSPGVVFFCCPGLGHITSEIDQSEAPHRFHYFPDIGLQFFSLVEERIEKHHICLKKNHNSQKPFFQQKKIQNLITFKTL